jgi:hypothetical protein
MDGWLPGSWTHAVRPCKKGPSASGSTRTPPPFFDPPGALVLKRVDCTESAPTALVLLYEWRRETGRLGIRADGHVDLPAVSWSELVFIVRGSMRRLLCSVQAVDRHVQHKFKRCACAKNYGILTHGLAKVDVASCTFSLIDTR